MGSRFFILDGHSLAHRLFYAMPPLSSRGRPMGAVFGFARILFKLIQEETPESIVVAFDTAAPTFRHRRFPEYKAHRDKTPDDLRPQLDAIKVLLKAFQIPMFEQPGYEADDILGTLAAFLEEKENETVIVTGDKDSLQLVDKRTRIRYTRKGISEIVDYDLETIKKEYGLEPAQLVDVKALMGDASDNIPGVPGIGEKTALKLIKEYGSLENLFANLEGVKRQRLREALTKYDEQARLSRDMGLIRKNVDLNVDINSLTWPGPDWEQVIRLFREWQFTSLMDNLPEAVRSRQQKKEEDVVFLEVNDDEKWAAFKAKFKPDAHMPVAFRLGGSSPRDYSLCELALKDREGGLFLLKPAGISDKKGIGEFLCSLFEAAGLKKSGHNLKPLVVNLLQEGIQVRGLAMDTALAVYLLDPAAATPSLSQLAERHTGARVESPLDEISQLPAVAAKLTAELKEQGLQNLLEELEMPLIPVLATMEYNGIKVNLEYLEELSREMEQRLEKESVKIYEMAGRPFNINSPQQLGVVLFEELKLPVIKKTKTGYGTGADVLEKLADRHPIIEHIFLYRQLAKLKSTYIDSLPPLVNAKTGRLHTSFHQTVTATGRLSSSEPNLQNIPVRTPEGQKIRRAFVAEPGYCLVGADYSQIELRVLAHIARAEGLLQAFKRGEDIHNRTAAEVFGVKPDEVTAEQRRRAKVINFGIAYGMSPYGLAEDLGVAREEARDYIERYFSRYPGIKEYIEETLEKARNDGYVTTVLKRRRYLPDINHRVSHRRGFAERMAINTPIQGSAADIMKLAMLKVYSVLKAQPQMRMLLQVHDEIILEVPANSAQAAGRILKEEMEAAYTLNVPLEVELKAGTNWMDMAPISV